MPELQRLERVASWGAVACLREMLISLEREVVEGAVSAGEQFSPASSFCFHVAVNSPSGSTASHLKDTGMRGFLART